MVVWWLAESAHDQEVMGSIHATSELLINTKSKTGLLTNTFFALCLAFYH